MQKKKKARSEKHRRFIASLPCVVCGRHETQAAHIRSDNGAGTSLKPGDDYCVPLCCTTGIGKNEKGCHEKQHKGEVEFWDKYGGILKATKLAQDLFNHTGNEEYGNELIWRFYNDLRI